MSLSFYFNAPCQKCGKPTVHAAIDRHPTSPDLAIQNFNCAHCGLIKTEVLQMKPPSRRLQQ
jgi:hypothetical protein